MNIVFKDFGIARKFKERWRGFPRKQTQTRAFLPLTEENDNQVASAPIPRLGFSSRALMEDKYFLKCILVPISVAGILQCATATKALEFELKGTLETEGHLAFGKVMQGETVNFTASVQNCNWLVRVSSAKPTEAQTYRQISCNGREMYVIGVNAKVGGASSWGGSVAPEGVPFYGPVTTLPVLWLAFGASCYLDKHPAAIVPPYSADVIRTQALLHVSRRTDVARLPEFIAFMADGTDWKDGVPRKRAAPYDSGFTNAIYTASGFTKVGGSDVPRDFDLVVFRQADTGRSSTDLETEFKYHGVVTNISDHCTLKQFVPAIPANTEGRISDTRFAHPDAISPQQFSYRASNWLSVEQVRELPGFLKYAESQEGLKSFVPILVTRRTREDE